MELKDIWERVIVWKGNVAIGTIATGAKRRGVDIYVYTIIGISIYNKELDILQLLK